MRRINNNKPLGEYVVLFVYGRIGAVWEKINKSTNKKKNKNGSF
jgi:hypothetical protein